MLIFQAFLAAIVGGILFTIIGIIPGTDETATMAPVTLVLVLMGFEPVVLFAWFIAIIVAMQISHTIPTAMAALPGSTMAVPMVHNCKIAKSMGIPHVAMKKLASGSLIGTFISLPLAVGLAYVLAPLSNLFSTYSGLVFTIGAVMIAFLSKAKWGAVVSLIPFSFLIQGLQRIATETVGHTLFISIFMGITIGPMIAELFNVLVPALRESQRKDSYSEIWLAPDSKRKYSLFPNPFNFFPKSQLKYVAASSVISSSAFTMSPVGMTVLMGELFGTRKKEVYDRTTTMLGIQDAVSNATYMAGLIIPMLAFGLPLTAVALGPAFPLFNAINLHDFLKISDYLLFGIIGIIGGALFAYPMSVHKARKWTEAMFRYVSHEAMIGAFVGLICMLSFYEAGIFGIIVALCIGLFGGIMSNLFQIHTGVQFMGYYASGYIVTQLALLAGMFV